MLAASEPPQHGDDYLRNSYLSSRWSQTAQFLHNLTVRKAALADEIRRQNAACQAVTTAAERASILPEPPLTVTSESGALPHAGLGAQAVGWGHEAIPAHRERRHSARAHAAMHGEALGSGSGNVPATLDWLIQSVLQRSSAVSHKLVKSCLMLPKDEVASRANSKADMRSGPSEARHRAVLHHGASPFHSATRPAAASARASAREGRRSLSRQPSRRAPARPREAAAERSAEGCSPRRGPVEAAAADDEEGPRGGLPERHGACTPPSSPPRPSSPPTDDSRAANPPYYMADPPRPGTLGLELPPVALPGSSPPPPAWPHPTHPPQPPQSPKLSQSGRDLSPGRRPPWAETSSQRSLLGRTQDALGKQLSRRAPMHMSMSHDGTVGPTAQSRPQVVLQRAGGSLPLPPTDVELIGGRRDGSGGGAGGDGGSGDGGLHLPRLGATSGAPSPALGAGAGAGVNAAAAGTGTGGQLGSQHGAPGFQPSAPDGGGYGSHGVAAGMFAGARRSQAGQLQSRGTMQRGAAQGPRGARAASRSSSWARGAAQR